MSNPIDPLLNMIRDEAYVPGPVILSSGRTSDFYVDCRRVTLTAKGQWLVGRVLARILETNPVFRDVDAIAGVALGGCAIATAATMLSSKVQHTLFVRKEAKAHGASAGSRVEGAPRPGMRVLLVEDVLTTGASAIDAARALREAGHMVEGVVALVDRQEGGYSNVLDAGLLVFPLFTKDMIVGGVAA